MVELLVVADVGVGYFHRLNGEVLPVSGVCWGGGGV